jgi:hypothetical protein
MTYGMVKVKAKAGGERSLQAALEFHVTYRVKAVVHEQEDGRGVELEMPRRE